VALVALFNHAYTWRYPIAFLNARKTKVEFAILCTKLVVMATSLEISRKVVQIDHLHPKRFHSVKRLRKSVQRILRSFVSEKSLKKDAEDKKKKSTQAKYIGLPASVPSGQN